jgi:hypothetical protein
MASSPAYVPVTSGTSGSTGPAGGMAAPGVGPAGGLIDGDGTCAGPPGMGKTGAGGTWKASGIKTPGPAPAKAWPLAQPAAPEAPSPALPGVPPAGEVVRGRAVGSGSAKTGREPEGAAARVAPVGGLVPCGKSGWPGVLGALVWPRRGARRPGVGANAGGVAAGAGREPSKPGIVASQGGRATSAWGGAWASRRGGSGTSSSAGAARWDGANRGGKDGGVACVMGPP